MIEDSQVEAEDRHQADHWLPARLLNSQASLTGNPNRPTQVLHRKATSDHAVKHFKDQAGIAQVEMNRLLQGRRQRKLLDLEGRHVGSKANSVEFVPIAFVRQDALPFNLASLAVA